MRLVALCAVSLAAAGVTEVEISPESPSVTLPSGTIVFSHSSSTVSLSILSSDLVPLPTAPGVFMGDLIATPTPAITFRPPLGICFVECVLFDVSPPSLGLICPVTRGGGREVLCACNSSLVTYRYEGRVCEPEKGVGFLAAVIVYFFIVGFVVDNVCRPNKIRARGHIYGLVASIGLIRMAQNISRLPTVAPLPDEVKICFGVVPELLQFLILRLMLDPKTPFVQWAMNVFTLIFLSICAILFAAVSQGSGSQLVIIVNLVLAGMLAVFVILGCVPARVSERLFPDKRHARVWVFLAAVLALAAQNGCLAAGFSRDEWLLSSTVAFLFFDVVFLELALFYHYHFEVSWQKIAPEQTIEVT